jgi:hypothetical protein
MADKQGSVVQGLTAQGLSLHLKLLVIRNIQAAVDTAAVQPVQHCCAKPVS